MAVHLRAPRPRLVRTTPVIHARRRSALERRRATPQCETEQQEGILCFAPHSLAVLTQSYHTHAAFSTDYNSEMPSGVDMEGDEDEGIDGWVATPGGRFWYIDTTDMITRQICGIGCLPADPNFIAGESGIIEISYSYNDLVIKLDE